MGNAMNYIKPLAVAISFANAVGASAALAQEEENTKSIDEIIVTATKTETSLMKTSIAISAFDQESLDRNNIKSIKDIANLVPNMDISVINGQSTPIISMRGVRSTNETELGDPAVGVHLDGVYSPRMQGIMSMMFDNERVEVLRGPQGTLFGRNSTVGSMNVISKRPQFDDEVSGNVNAELGRWNAKSFWGALNVPVTDTFALRFAGKVHERDSYIDVYYDPNQYDQRYLNELDPQIGQAPIINGANTFTPTEGLTRTQHSNWWIDWAGGGRPIRELTKADPSDSYGNADEHGYRMSALWEPTDKWSVYASYQKYNQDSAGGIDLVNCEKLRGRPHRDANGAPVDGVIGDCSTLFPQDDTYTAVVNVPGKLYLDIDYYRARVDYDINDNVRAAWIAGWEKQDRESAQDMEQSLNAWDGAMFFLPGTGSESYSHELQLVGSGDKLNWIVGANLFHEQTVTKGFYQNSIQDVAFWDQPDRSSDSYAFFGQATYSLTEQLHMTLGLRYSNEEKEDVGGRGLTCAIWNGCYSNGVWWDPNVLNAQPSDAYYDPSIYPEFQENDNYGEWDSTDWRIGLDYDLNEDTLLYTYLATGFKSGGIGDVIRATDPYTGENIEAKTSFGQENVTTFEVGVKTSLLDNSLNLSANYFFMDYEDMQYASVGPVASIHQLRTETNPDGSPVLDGNGDPVQSWVLSPMLAYYTQNVPGAEIQGIEVEFDWKPFENGRMSGFFTWTDTEIVEDWNTKWNYDPVAYFGIPYEESQDPNNPLLQVNLKGNELAVTPPFEINLNYEHWFEIKGVGNIVPWINIHWEDDSYLTVWNVEKHVDNMNFVIPDEDIHYTDDKRDAFVTANATVKWIPASERWYAEAFVYNITDEVVQYWGGAAEGVAKGSMSQPRYMGIRVGMNW